MVNQTNGQARNMTRATLPRDEQDFCEPALCVVAQRLPMTLVTNAGAGECLVAWDHVLDQFDLAATTRQPGQLMQMLSWSLAGGAKDRIAGFSPRDLELRNDSGAR